MKEGIIVPIAKKIEENKKVALMPTAYAIAERLRKKIEEKKKLPEKKAGFKKGRRG